MVGDFCVPIMKVWSDKLALRMRLAGNQTRSSMGLRFRLK